MGAVALLLSGCTPAPVSDIEYRNATLGLQGGSVDVTVTFTCEKGWNIAFGSVRLVQARGDKLAQGDGAFVRDFPGVPCTGDLQGARMTVFNTSPWVFAEGKAAINGDVTVFDPNTGDLPTTSAQPREIRIVSVVPAPSPSAQERPTPDPRYTAA
jgi:hypothetical protein